MTGEANLFLADLQQPAPDPSSLVGRMDPEVGDFLAIGARQPNNTSPLLRDRDTWPDLRISPALEISLHPIAYSLNGREFAVSGKPGPLRQVNKRQDVCLNRTPGCECRSHHHIIPGVKNRKHHPLCHMKCVQDCIRSFVPQRTAARVLSGSPGNCVATRRRGRRLVMTRLARDSAVSVKQGFFSALAGAASGPEIRSSAHAGPRPLWGERIGSVGIEDFFNSDKRIKIRRREPE